MTNGEMPEWSIGAVSKTVIPSGIQGSNPCLSAKGKVAREASMKIEAFFCVFPSAQARLKAEG